MNAACCSCSLIAVAPDGRRAVVEPFQGPP